MKIIEPRVDILAPVPLQSTVLLLIEQAGRTCYKSEREFTVETATKFVEMLIKKGHESVLEHISFTVRFVVDRGVSHEIVRHRLASYSQESTRYCNYSAEKFGSEITVIEPWGFSPLERDIWFHAMEMAERQYMMLVGQGCKAEWARSVLPNSLKTEIVMTANAREWRHFFKLRAAPTAHPQMLQVVNPLLWYFRTHVPGLFSDIDLTAVFDSAPRAEVREIIL